MNELKILQNETFGKVRVVMQDGKPWFVASDVARALGYANPKKAVIDHCKHVKLLKGNESLPLTESPRGINIIPESDVYRLIARSNLPAAVQFEAWMFEDAIPTILNTGSYGKKSITAEDILKDPRAMAAMFTAYAEQQEQLALTSAQLEKAQADKEAAIDACFELAAQATMLNKVLAGTGSITVGMAAKDLQSSLGINIGRNRLYKELQAMGMVMKERNHAGYIPTQRGQRSGYFKIAANYSPKPDGSVTTYYSINVTAKGLDYLRSKFSEKMNLCLPVCRSRKKYIRKRTMPAPMLMFLNKIGIK